MKTRVCGLAARIAPSVVALAVVAGIGLQLPAGASAAASPADKCELSKAKAAGKLAACRSNAYSAAIKKGLATDAEKLLKCSDKINSSFGKAEDKAEGACPTTSDVAAIETEINACVDGVLADLGGVPGPGGDEAKCQASKVKEAGKYADCRFKALAKGINKALAPDFSKCEEKQLNKWTKLEEKPCSTTLDQAAVKADIDACYNSVADAIDDIPPATPTPTLSPTATPTPTPAIEYSEDFEALDQGSSSALGDAGWQVGANIFAGLPPGGGYLGGYFAFPAPNPGGGFSALVVGEGGTEQGAQQVSIYSDYNNNTEHNAGNTIEANVFRQRSIVAGDVGRTFTFQFDHKLGNLNSPLDPQCPSALGGPFDGTACANSAAAFIKVFDSGFGLLDFPNADMTLITNVWGTTSVTTAPIPAGAVGGYLQIGFLNRASLFQPSGIFYDNLILSSVP